MTDTLLPCPFCGSDRTHVCESPYHTELPDGPQVFTVVCRVCACEGGWAKTESGARRNWNRRDTTDLDAARHEAAQQAQAAEMWRNSHTAADLRYRQQAEELARLRADLADAQARADRLAAERREGIAREASLALTVERLAWAWKGMEDFLTQAAHAYNEEDEQEYIAPMREALALTTTALDAAPAALLQAARAVLAEVAAREGLKQALYLEAPPLSLREASDAHDEAERALDSAADALRAARLAGEGE